MMKKIFTRWVACTLSLVTFLEAHEGGEKVSELQKDRERLVNLVIDLEEDFTQTLKDYSKLQAEYATLLKRPKVKDQSNEVKKLSAQLTAVTAKMKLAESDNQIDLNKRALIERDLINLRNELHRERQELLVAKAQILRVQQLEEKEKSLELALKKEGEKNAKVLGELQSVRGERDALLVKMEGLMARAEKAEKGYETAKQNIFKLEGETNALKLKLKDQEVELQKLRVEQAHNKGALASAANLKKEQQRLNGLLESREKKLKDLRSDLAVEMKRSLDIPLLIKTRDELQAKLKTSDANALGLKKKNVALTQKQTQLQKEIEKVQKSIAGMQKELSKNKTAMAQVAQLGTEKKLLLRERDQLNDTIEKKQNDLKKSQDLLQATKDRLAESLKEVEKIAEFRKENGALLSQIEELKGQFTSAQSEMGELKKKAAKNQSAIEMADELEQRVAVLSGERDLLDAKLKEAKSGLSETEKNLKEAKMNLAKKEEIVAAGKKVIAESETLRKSLSNSQIALKKAKEAASEVGQLKKAYETLSRSAAELGNEKLQLSKQMAKRDDELKNLRLKLANLAKKPDTSADLIKLQKEKEKLSADLAKREADLKKTRGELGRMQLSASVANKQLNEIRRETAKIEPVRYAKGEADVTEQQARVLNQVQKVLQLFPSARFEIVGHTCDLGSAEGNLRLSEQRAKALHDFLIEKGIKEDRLKARGVGLAEPVVPNISESNRRKNRRVVVEILD